MDSPVYRIIEHTADIGFEVWGATKEQVFESAASAFFDIMWHIAASSDSGPEVFAITGGDLEELLVNFLEEFLYFFDARNLVCTRVQVESVSNKRVQGRAWLQEFNAEADEELLSVKAVTYHQLFIGRERGRWTARIFLDI